MKILYVYGSMASFTRADLETLRVAHEVRELHFRRAPRHLPGSIVQAIRGALWSDLIFAWFGSIHALVPFLAGRALGRPCLVIAGGYDVACEPSIDYGNMRPGIRKLIGRAVFALATRVLAFSEFASREVLGHAGVPQARVEVIPLGVAAVDAGREPPAPPETRTGVLTVSIINESNLTRKGLTTFVETARRLPEERFTLVGEWTDRAADLLRQSAPPNLELTGWISGKELLHRMNTSRVYVQVSFHEAFGVALAEAMLAGCVPVVTARGSLPEVVGETGLYVAYADPDATAAAIRTALARPELGIAARERIQTTFPPALRRERLLHAITAAGTPNS